jgi:hypothetical protein
MTCHRAVARNSPQIAEIRRFVDAKMPIPWVRAYRNPDFVFFSHERHARGKVACAECHGPVQTRDVLAKEVSTSMDACIACHRQRNASTECNVCHELGQ